MESSGIRRKAAGAACEMVGLEADPAQPEAYRRYLDLVAPGETPEVQDELAMLSSSALIVAGIWRSVGVESPRLDPPYQLGTSSKRLMDTAADVGAWVPFAADVLPDLGDAVFVGSGPDEQVYVVTAVVAGDTTILESVGSGGRRRRGIAARKHVWKDGQDRIDDGDGEKSLPIRGWIDVSRLPLKPVAGLESISFGTDGTNQLPSTATTASASQMVASMTAAWPGLFGGAVPKPESVFVLVAQWALETARGKAMHAYNVGNIKSRDGDGHDYTYFACWELNQQRQKYWIYPEDPGCRFRAYQTLDLGVADYLQTLSTRYAKAWPAVLDGDPGEFAHLLKTLRYYTGDETIYANSLRSIFAELQKTTSTTKGPDLHTTLGVQQALKTLGYDPGTPDGRMGPRTESAIEDFQRDTGLEPDGIVGPATREALADGLAAKAAPAVAAGDTPS